MSGFLENETMDHGVHGCSVGDSTSHTLDALIRSFALATAIVAAGSSAAFHQELLQPCSL